MAEGWYVCSKILIYFLRTKYTADATVITWRCAPPIDKTSMNISNTSQSIVFVFFYCIGDLAPVFYIINAQIIFA